MKNSRRFTLLRNAGYAATLVTVAAILGFSFVSARWVRVPPEPEKELAKGQQKVTLVEILGNNTESPGGKEIALINLVCAEDLPGGDKIDQQEARGVLDSWANRVKSETEKYHHKFQQNPASFNHSEPYFKVLTMITVLQQDFGVRYNPAHTATSNSPESNDAFFTNASDLFLNGILGPRRLAAC